MVKAQFVPAAIAVGLALTGCTHWDSEAANVTLAPPTQEPSTVLSQEHSQWIGVGDRKWRNDVPAAPNPSLGIAKREAGPLDLGGPIMQPITSEPGAVEACTAGAEFVNSAGGTVMLSAGHCDRSPGEPVSVDLGGGRLVPVGHYVTADSKGKPLPEDIAGLELLPGVQPSPRSTLVGGLWPVVGVLDATKASELPLGTSVCFTGANLGLRCGPLTSATDHSARVDLPGVHVGGGDSGGAAWLIDTAGNAVLLGSIVDGPDSPRGIVMRAVYVDSTVRALGLKIVTR